MAVEEFDGKENVGGENVSLFPTSFANAAAADIGKQKVIEKMTASDAALEAVLKERNYEIQRAGRNSLDQASYRLTRDTIVDKGDMELKENGFEIYEVNADNHKDVEKKLKTNLDDLFREDATVQPESYTIYVAENGTTSVDPENTVIVKSKIATTSEATATELDWRSLYIYASDDPIMAKLGTFDVYAKYSTWPYNDSINDIVSKTYGAVTSLIPNYLYVWTILGALGIDYNSIEYDPRQTYDIEVGANWTRKHIQIWNEYDQAWQTGCSTEYVDWNAYDDLWYYSNIQNQMVRDSSNTTGTVFATHWNDYTWLIDQAETGYWYSYIIWDITGDYIHKYDGDEIIRLNENF